MNREAIEQTLKQESLEQLRVLWCDNSNVIRTKSVYLPSLRLESGDLIDRLEHAVTVTAAVQAAPATFDSPAREAGLAPVHDIRLVPDWNSLAKSAVEPSIAMVLGDMVLGEAPWEICPRNFLRRAVTRIAEQGIEIEVGFEIEFFLLQPPEVPSQFPDPADHTVYASTVSAQKNMKVIRDILRSLWSQGIRVAQYNPEAGPGQQEISLQHEPPMIAADHLVLARETIREVARDHGLIATFLPDPFDDATGSGLHTHFSLWRSRQNLLPDVNAPWNLSSTANSFMAGILEHLPGLMAMTTPSVNSYRRIKPQWWAGAYQAWGIENKEAAIRLINDAKLHQPTHFELKTIDGSANPYIALGGLITTGLTGITQSCQLPEPTNVDPGALTEQQRQNLHVAALPTSLDKSLEFFSEDEVLWEGMGREFAHVFLAVRRAELETMRDMTAEAERRLLLERY